MLNFFAFHLLELATQLKWMRLKDTNNYRFVGVVLVECRQENFYKTRLRNRRERKTLPWEFMLNNVVRDDWIKLSSELSSKCCINWIMASTILGINSGVTRHKLGRSLMACLRIWNAKKKKKNQLQTCIFHLFRNCQLNLKFFTNFFSHRFYRSDNFYTHPINVLNF